MHLKEELGVAEALLNQLLEQKLVTESYVSVWRSKQKVLAEFDGEWNLVAEALKTIASGLPKRSIAPSKKGEEYVDVKEIPVYIPHFLSIWENLAYTSVPDVLRKLDIPLDKFPQEELARDKLQDIYNYAVAHKYREFYFPFRDRVKYLGKSGRLAAGNPSPEEYKNNPEKYGGSSDPRKTDYEIDWGHKGTDRTPTGKTIQKVNDEDILPGTLYSNRTHIPRRKWASWFKFWNQHKTHVKQEKGRGGRIWKKSFILGYQIDRNMFYEIWYNSIDSTFTVHDRRGIQLGRRFPTLQEAMKQFFEFIVMAEKRTDPETFNGLNNSVAASVARTVSKEVTTSRMMKQLEKEEARARMSYNQRKRADRKEKKAAKDSRNRERSVSREKTYRKVSSVAGAVGDVANSKAGQAATEYAKKAGQAATEYAKKGKGKFSDFVNSELDNIAGDSKKSDRAAYNAVKKSSPTLTAKQKKDKEDSRRELERAAEQKKYNDLVNGMSEAEENDAWITNEADIDDLESILSGDEEETPQNSDELVSQAVEDKANSMSYKSFVKAAKKKAETSHYTKSLIRNDVLENVVDIYRETRISKNMIMGRFSRILRKFVGRGRSEKLELPSRITPIRTEDGSFRNAFYTSTYIADFVIGFSIHEAVNIEIWYITEPNRVRKIHGGDTAKLSSSYYVYDVTAKKLIRSHLPHYRNAVKVAMNKIAPLN